MSEADLTNAAWWAWFWGEIEHWAFLLVVVFLAIEFAALKLGAPYKEKLDAAREARLVELTAQNETARSESAKARREQEQLRAANLALEKQLTPRRVPDDQIAAFADAFREHTGKTAIIRSYALDTDGIIFAQQILTALTTARLTVHSDIASLIPTGRIELGVHIRGKDSGATAKIALAISTFGNTLVKIDDASALASAEVPDFVILVGAKPPEPLQGVIGADDRPLEAAPVRPR